MLRHKRSPALPFYLAVGLILLVVPLAYLLLLESGAAREQPVAEKLPRELRLTQARGRVQVRKAQGEWMAAREGDLLRASDSVRTAEASQAVLVGGQEYEVQMEPATEITTAQLTDSISRLLLVEGMATAKVRGQGRHTFEVKAAAADALARAGEATFTISSNGAGTVALGASSGEVQFLGGGKTVVVRGGQQSIIRPGAGPSEPGLIPSSLLLKVELPASTTVRQPRLVVVGQVEPGARLELAGQTIEVGADGRFTHALSLKEGPNSISIRGKSVGRLEGESRHQVVLDTTVKASLDPGIWEKEEPEAAP